MSEAQLSRMFFVMLGQSILQTERASLRMVGNVVIPLRMQEQRQDVALE